MGSGEEDRENVERWRQATSAVLEAELVRQKLQDMGKLWRSPD
jgi:hypothetical protein